MSHDPEAVGAVARIEARIVKRGECWEFPGSLTADGYGRVAVGRRSKGTRRSAVTHRLMYEHHVGPIPDGLHLDHLCRNRACCNPAHLEPVTPGENVRRSSRMRATATHCANGHEWTDDTTYVRPHGGRECRKCARERHRKIEGSTDGCSLGDECDDTLCTDHGEDQ